MDIFGQISYRHLDPSPGEPLHILVNELRLGQARPNPAHVHCALEIGIVRAGIARREFSDWLVRLLPGQIWLAGCLEPHAGHPVTSRMSSVAFVVRPETLMSDPFSEIDWLSPFFAPAWRRPQFHGAKARRESVRIAETVIRLQRDKPAAWRTLAWLELHRLMCLALRDWHPPSDRGPRSKVSPERIGPAIRLVKERPSRPVRLTEAARACLMSPCRFSAAFTSAMGIPFAKFALRVRLAGAAHDLRAHDDGLKALAARWGFTDASHLHRLFTQHYGCTPGQYRSRSIPVDTSPRKP